MVTARYPWWITAAVFATGALVAGATVAGPGLAWDEPAYRYSQIAAEHWFGELSQAESMADLADLFSADSIQYYWQYSRFGHNFHPPMAGMLNLLTYGLLGGIWDDLSARRLASALELAGAAAILCHFLGRRYGPGTGVLAALSFLTMPRLMGDAHLVGTDMPLCFFWGAAALTFYRALEARCWQWCFATLFACLFLVKFSGVVLAAPCLVWFVATVLLPAPGKHRLAWLAWSVALSLPLVPLATTLLFVPTGSVSSSDLSGAVAMWGLEHSKLMRWLYLWPLMILGCFRLLSRARRDADWNPGLELPWVVLAWTPLVSIAGNPGWWHDPVRSLANYFSITLGRQDVLPPIEIFYWGERYLYSLPWHNAWVLLAVTVPFGTLLLGGLGALLAVFRFRADRLPLYLALQFVTLPLFRALPTPAHDGVRLFLPTFFFLAALAGLAAHWLTSRVTDAGRWRRRAAWVVLFAVGPVWSAIEWLRIHPYELSYYNVGLRRAMDWGFEPTYWYDAVTPRVVAELNERLPTGVVIGFPDPLINPDTFGVLQDMGRLRVNLAMTSLEPDQFPWFWLLTHSSKASAFTRLLHAVEPWYASGHDGVRLFAVVDERGAALAWSLHALSVDYDPRDKLGAPRLHEATFNAEPETLRAALAALATIAAGGDTSSNLSDLGPAARELALTWMERGELDRNLARVLRRYPWAVDAAAAILIERPDDVRRILLYPGYLRPERFGGTFPIPPEQPESDPARRGARETRR